MRFFRHPAVSADGEWIAFDSEFGHFGDWAIGIVRKDGTGLRQVTDSGHRDLYPDWSPDGRYLAFQSNRSGRGYQAWIVNADGGGLRLVTDTPGFRIHDLLWSPDGSQLAMSNPDGEAYVSGADKAWSEEPPTQLPPLGDEDERFCPKSWSPDGKLLAGVTVKQGQEVEGGAERRVALYSFDSRSYRILTEPLGVVSLSAVYPQWLKDGRRLFFTSSRESNDSAFSILDAETGEQHEVFSSGSLADRQDGEAYMAAISRDGRDVYVQWFYTESAISMLTLGEQE